MADVLFTYNLDIDPWVDLDDDTPDGLVSRVGIIPDGTESGRPVVVFAVKLLDTDKEVIGQITWKQFKELYSVMETAPAIVLDSM